MNDYINTKSCPKCGEIIPANVIICPRCGKNTTTSYYSNSPKRNIWHGLLKIAVFFTVIGLLTAFVYWKWTVKTTNSIIAAHEMCKIGDLTSIKTTSGNRIRGKIIYIYENSVTILTTENIMVDVEFNSIDSYDRIRFDKVYKDSFTKDCIKKALKSVDGQFINNLKKALQVACKKSHPPFAFEENEFIRLYDYYYAIILDTMMSKCHKNGKHAIRKLNGQVLHGELLDLDNKYLSLVCDGNTNKLALSEISIDDRLAIDKNYIEDYTSYCALSKARQTQEYLGVKIPIFMSDETNRFITYMNYGNTNIFLRKIKKYLNDSDYHNAFPILVAASVQNHSTAQYIIGRMYIEGKGLTRNKKKGIEWISLAKSQGNSSATEYLKKYKISMEDYQKALAAANQRREREKINYSKRLEEARKNPTRAVILRERGFEKSGRK